MSATSVTKRRGREIASTAERSISLWREGTSLWRGLFASEADIDGIDNVVFVLVVSHFEGGGGCFGYSPHSAAEKSTSVARRNGDSQLRVHHRYLRVSQLLH
jgi:hypothetical protein